MKPAVPDTGGPEMSLQRGMAADEVKRLMGKPEVIKPLQAPTGTAEIWVYSRRIPGRTEQVLVSSAPTTVTVMGANGTTTTQTIGGEPIYRTVHHVTLETVEVLMFNRHFLEKKITRLQRQEFD